MYMNANSGTPSKFWWGSGETWGVGWIDDVKIYSQN